MLERYTLIGIVFALVIISLDFYLLRKRKIQGKGFVFWFTVGIVIGLFSMVPFLYSLLNFLYGTEATISAVTATTFLFFLLILLYQHSRISEMQNLLMKLATEISLIKYDREHVEQESTKLNPKKIKKPKDKNE